MKGLHTCLLYLTQHRRNTTHTHRCRLLVLGACHHPLFPLTWQFCSECHRLAEWNKKVIVPVLMLCHVTSWCCLSCMSNRMPHWKQASASWVASYPTKLQSQVGADTVFMNDLYDHVFWKIGLLETTTINLNHKSSVILAQVPGRLKYSKYIRICMHQPFHAYPNDFVIFAFITQLHRVYLA